MIPDEDKRQVIYQDRITSFFDILALDPLLLAKPREEVILDFNLLNEANRFYVGVIIPQSYSTKLICWEQYGLKQRFGILVSNHDCMVVTPDVFLVSDNIHPQNNNWIILDSKTKLEELCYTY
jgi:hypothetical protein